MKITREDFDLWLANPVTEAVMSSCAFRANDDKELWVSFSWDRGQVDRVYLAALRARADAFELMSTFEFDHLLEELREDEQPERDSAD